MIAALHQVDEILRGDISIEPPRRPVIRLIFIILFFGILYGALMGSYGGFSADRILQPLYSSLKVPLLLLVSFALSLPSFYVLNMLLGVAEDFPEVLRSLIARQATLTIVLASLSPFTLLWYASFADHDNAILFNAAMFAIASFSAQWILRRYYNPLIARNPRHRWLLRCWLIIYAFVGIQMAWVLRPFIGDPRLPVAFFREDSWTNAYIFLANMIFRLARAAFNS